MSKILLFVTTLGLSSLTFAGEVQLDADTEVDASSGLSATDQKALNQTQDLLKSKGERDAFIKKDEKAKKADDFVNQLTGGDSALSEEAYALAADVFAILVKENNGDTKKMKEDIEKFTRDPAAFAEKFTPEQRQKLKALSQKIKPPAPAKN